MITRTNEDHLRTQREWPIERDVILDDNAGRFIGIVIIGDRFEERSCVGDLPSFVATNSVRRFSTRVRARRLRKNSERGKTQ